MEEAVATNDYKVNVAGKVKTFHINLLKKFHQRQNEETEDTGARGGVLEIACAAILEPSDGEGDLSDTIDEEDMVVLGTCNAAETRKDVKYGNQLTKEQRAQAESIIEEFGAVFTDLPGSTD